MFRFYPSVFRGTLQAPASKAYAQRLLFAAAMSTAPTTVSNVPACDDIDVTLDCLTALGCKIRRSGFSRLEVVVEPFPKTTPLMTTEFNFRQSATTARFAIALCAAIGMKAVCKASGTLPKRQTVDLTSRMAIRGVRFSSFSFPLDLEGRLEGGEYTCRGDEGSQIISALLFALPLLRDDSFIRLESPLIERSFIDVTLNVLEEFGIRIEETEEGFRVPGRQLYKTPGRVVCENDWSLASLWVLAGAACAQKGGKITVTDLPKASPQIYRSTANVFAIMSQNFKDVNVDAAGFPDLAPVLAAIACAKGASITLTGTPQLRYKETDRLRSIGQALEAFGASFELIEGGLILRGQDASGYPEDVRVDCQEDPWVFMALAVASCVFEKPFILTNQDCAKKVYGDFLAHFSALGGKYEEI